jgi:hypothetical protein
LETANLRPRRMLMTMLEIIMGILILVLLVAAIVLFVRVGTLSTRVDAAYKGAEQLTTWVNTEAPKMRALFDAHRARINQLGAFHQLADIPPGGGVPASDGTFPP